MEKPEIIRVPQIARLCDVTEESIRQWCRSQWLKSHKVYGDQEWIIYFEDLIEHFATTRRHYGMLLDSNPERLRDQALKKQLLKEIVKMRRNRV